MKRSDLKKIMKPLVEECIKESVLEGGIISNIITEVVKGVSITAGPQHPAPVTSAPPVDPTTERMRKNAFRTERTPALQEQKQQLMAAIGQESFNGVNLFEGTTPVPNQQTPQQQARPLSDASPTDPGVDISSLFSGTVTKSWNAHMSHLDEGK